MLVFFLLITLAWMFGTLHAYLGKVYLLILFDISNFAQVRVCMCGHVWCVANSSSCMYTTIHSAGSVCICCLPCLGLEGNAEEATGLLPKG